MNFLFTTKHQSIKAKLLKNFSSLLILQISQYIFPLITFPYLVRVLGPEKFGLINLASAFTFYFTILTDYGFGLSASREISLHQKDLSTLSKIVSVVLLVKAAFFFISFIVFFTFILSFPLFKSEYALLFSAFGFVFANILFPTWFFQGMERMNYITALNVIFKGLSTILIFISVKESADYVLVMLIQSASLSVAGLISLRIIRRSFKIKFYFTGIPIMLQYVKDGWHLFLTSLAQNLSSASVIFILGLFTNNTSVGYYAAADKIRIAFQGCITTISLSVYPHVAVLFKKSFSEGASFTKKLIKVTSIIGILISLVLFFFSNELVLIILGADYSPSAIILKVLSFVVFFSSVNNMIGVQVLINTGRKVLFSRVIISAFVLCLALSLVFVPIFFEIGSGIAVLLTEASTTGFLMYYIIVNNRTLLQREIYS